MRFFLTAALSFLVATASAAASAAFVCPVKHPVPQKDLTDIPEVINTEMDKRFKAVSDAAGLERSNGKDKPVDAALMTAMAHVAGCGALIDKESSCSIYYSTHVGSPLSVFMDMKKSNPLRRQFVEAVKAIPNKSEREAALHCIKLTGE